MYKQTVSIRGSGFSATDEGMSARECRLFSIFAYLDVGLWSILGGWLWLPHTACYPSCLICKYNNRNKHMCSRNFNPFAF